jgi:hypothetical protein
MEGEFLMFSVVCCGEVVEDAYLVLGGDCVGRRLGRRKLMVNSKIKNQTCLFIRLVSRADEIIV